MKIKMTLDSLSIENAINSLKQYAEDLNEKDKTFVSKLADAGISIARISANEESQDGIYNHQFSSMVAFEKKYKGKSIYIIGRNADLSKLRTKWYDGDGNPHDETISPILALEYGTAGFAIKGHGGSASVTGNFTNSTEWMFYQDIDENKNPINPRFATAEKAHQPMYKAFVAMKNQVINIAKEVYKS